MSLKLSIHHFIEKQVHHLQKYVNRWWYAPLIGLLAAADNIVLIIPNDGILISSTMILPKRWLSFALFVAVGSTCGALSLGMIVEHNGFQWLQSIYPSIDQSQVWNWTRVFFNQYGLIVVFLIALAPLPQQPAVILASLSETPMIHLVPTIFAGRIIKYLVMSYVASHAPRLLKKMWGIKHELEEVGVKLP